MTVEDRTSTTTDTDAALIESVVAVADRVLDQPFVGVWRYDADEDRLVPLAGVDATTDRGSTLDRACPTDPIPPGTIEMEVFRGGTSRLVEDYRRVASPAYPESALRTVLMVPLDDYGQLHVGSGTVEAFDSPTREVVRLLARQATVALAEIERVKGLQRRNETLKAFTNTLAHDLRNPLNVLTGRVSLLRETSESEHFDEIEIALDRIDALIEDTLALAQAGRLVREPNRVDLTRVVETAWRTIHGDEAALELVDGLEPVQGNGSRIQQLFENLFQNAVVHVGPDVTVRVGPLDDGIYVEDDGPGIPASERELVFERGFSACETGTGLGLDIVRQIAAGHGWRITVTEGAAGGCRFEITGLDRRG